MITINATHIGRKLDGIGRFSLYIVKHFLKKGNFKIVLNSDALYHITSEEVILKNKNIKILPKILSPNKGLKAHILRLIYSNFLKGTVFNLSQLEISFWNKNQIVVVHDIIPLIFPEYHRKQYFFYKKILPRILKIKTKGIIAVSNHTKKLLVELYNIPEEKIKVIYNGIEIPKLENKHKDNYILYVGRASPTKNIERLIKAFLELKKHSKFSNLKLYLVGANISFSHKDIFIFRSVSDKQLDRFYRQAKIFLFPTLYEGFGYPVLEAMARKTAVIASKVASIPEIGGDAICYIENPYSVGEIAEKLRYLLENKSFREKLEEKAFKQALKFDINKTLNAYENYLEQIN